MLCPNCQSKNRDAAKFCDECGFPLTGAIARAAHASLLDNEAEAFTHANSNAANVRGGDLGDEIVESAQYLPFFEDDEDVREQAEGDSTGAVAAVSGGESIDEADGLYGIEVPVAFDGTSGGAGPEIETAKYGARAASSGIGDIEDEVQAAGEFSVAATPSIAVADGSGQDAFSVSADSAQMVGAADADLAQVPGSVDADPTQMIGSANGDSTQTLVSEDANSAQMIPSADADPTQMISSADADPTQMIGAGDADPTQMIGSSDPTQVIIPNDGDVTQVIASGAAAGVSASNSTHPVGRDLSGFDRVSDYGEALVDSSYDSRIGGWHDGGTMKMNPVASDDGMYGARDYIASATTEQKSHKGRNVAIALIVLALVAAAAVYGTYVMELWGGKAVPGVVGMTEADARSVLEGSGFTVKSLQVKSDETEGLVLIMDPSEGSRIEEGSEVTIHMATARTIPEVIGLPQEEAAVRFKEDGFENVSFELEKSDSPENTVISVSPEVGERARSGQSIVAKVADPYIVPDVAGMYLQDAQDAIANAGLTSEYYYVNTRDYPDGAIMGTQPAAGEKVTHDTVVSIQIARARAAELEDLTREYLAPGAHITMGAYSYEIETLNSVEYTDNDMVAFSATARPYTSILGETVYISARPINGTIHWSEDNHVISIS